MLELIDLPQPLELTEKGRSTTHLDQRFVGEAERHFALDLLFVVDVPQREPYDTIARRVAQPPERDDHATHEV